MAADRFPNLRAAETRVLTFDFSADLEAGESLTAVDAVAVSVLKGSDAAPNDIKRGTAQISGGNKVLQAVAGLEVGADYQFAVTCTTSNPQKILCCVGKVFCPG